MPSLPPFLHCAATPADDAAWKADLRLFAIVWAAGFVFVLVLLG